MQDVADYQCAMGMDLATPCARALVRTSGSLYVYLPLYLSTPILLGLYTKTLLVQGR